MHIALFVLCSDYTIPKSKRELKNIGRTNYRADAVAGDVL